MVYSFDIDEKSLFVGVFNDYKVGQSATVHTPLNQSKDENKWRTKIYDFLKIYPSENVDTLPDTLKDKCLSKTTSKAKGKILNFCVFSSFSLDGVPFDVDCCFAMYVKEEIDKVITKRDNSKAENTHYKRQKLHYLKSLNHCADGYNINNRKVLNKIIEVNGGFAYVVNGFDYDTESKRLNFRTTMVGPQGVFLSNVFKRKKGVGEKLLVDSFKSWVSKNDSISEDENDTFYENLRLAQQACRSNGKNGERYVLENLNKIFDNAIIDKPVHVSEQYPQSPYDIECLINGTKTYIEVKSTKGEKKFFYMSKGERRFMDKYKDHYVLVLITNVNSNRKNRFKYFANEIMDESIMRQELQGIKFIVK